MIIVINNLPESFLFLTNKRFDITFNGLKTILLGTFLFFALPTICLHLFFFLDFIIRLGLLFGLVTCILLQILKSYIRFLLSFFRLIIRVNIYLQRSLLHGAPMI